MWDSNKHFSFLGALQTFLRRQSYKVYVNSIPKFFSTIVKYKNWARLVGRGMHMPTHIHINPSPKEKNDALSTPASHTAVTWFETRGRGCIVKA